MLTAVNSGGAENFIAGPASFNGTDMYKAFQAKGFNVVHSKTELLAAGNDKKTLGIFSSMLRSYLRSHQIELIVLLCSI